MGEAEHDHPLPEPFVLTQDYIKNPEGPKYKDQDVLNHPILQRAVYDYLQTYHGNFIFLRRAKTTLFRTGTLDVSVVRGVLNCMRHRASLVHGLPKPGVTIPLKPEITFVPKDRTPVKRKPFEIPTNWKAKYVLNRPYSDDWVSTKGKGPVYHFLNPTTSTVMYYPDGLWRSPVGDVVPYLDITPRTYCGYTFRDGVAVINLPRTATPCANCLRKTEALESVNDMGRSPARPDFREPVRYGDVPETDG